VDLSSLESFIVISRSLGVMSVFLPGIRGLCICEAGKWDNGDLRLFLDQSLGVLELAHNGDEANFNPLVKIHHRVASVFVA
jgi:hypothetical protein